ncbi:Beta-amyrin synthase [Glycine soja]|uniref:Beta-amyrin synthase n=1 Tax=Glycine soja TaxID=3848 RepID=A0A0B2RDH5_GLYSO|nr:Beta-amyrin synthase [Glycine soja]
MEMAWIGYPDVRHKNFKLRVETWEFDPEADTPEERAQVEAACQHFYHNRFKAKPCADLLWCFQVLRENNFKQTIPSVTIEDGEEITYQKVTSAIRRGAHHLATLQTTDGHWPAQIVGPLFFLPPLALEALEKSNIKIDSYGGCHRNSDGVDKVEALKH